LAILEYNSLLKKVFVSLLATYHNFFLYLLVFANVTTEVSERNGSAKIRSSFSTLTLYHTFHYSLAAYIQGINSNLNYIVEIKVIISKHHRKPF